MEVVWSDFAIATFIGVLSYIRTAFGEAVSRKIRKRIENTVQLLSNQPKMGVVDFDNSDNEVEYRYIVVQKSKIYYMIENNIVYILLVWDCRQNPDKLKTILLDDNINKPTD